MSQIQSSPSVRARMGLVLLFAFWLGSLSWSVAQLDFRTFNPRQDAIFAEDNTGGDQFVSRVSAVFHGNLLTNEMTVDAATQTGLGLTVGEVNGSTPFVDGEGNFLYSNTALTWAKVEPGIDGSMIATHNHGTGAGHSTQSKAEFASRRLFKVTSASVPNGTRVDINVTLRGDVELETFFGPASKLTSEGNAGAAGFSIDYYLFPTKQRQSPWGENLQWRVSFTATTFLRTDAGEMQTSSSMTTTEYNPAVISSFPINTDWAPTTPENRLGDVIAGGAASRLGFPFEKTVALTVTVGEEFGILTYGAVSGNGATGGIGDYMDQGSFRGNGVATGLGALAFDGSAADVMVLPSGIATHELNVSVVDDAQGVVSPGGLTTHAEGAVIDVLAQPAWGYQFLHWEGDVISTENPVSVVMDADKALVAHFVRAFELESAADFQVTEDGDTTFSVLFNTPVGASLLENGFDLDGRVFRLQGSTDMDIWNPLTQEEIMSLSTEGDGTRVRATLEIPQEVQVMFLRVGE